MSEHWTREEINRLAASAVRKIDLWGQRGTTLCSLAEIEAMACHVALSGPLPTLGPAPGAVPDATPLAIPDRSTS